MGCFGKCGCEECCLSEEDMADIATSVEIEHPLYTETVEFVHSDCCNTAEAGPSLTNDYDYLCGVVNDNRTNESISITSLMYKSKKVNADPPATGCEFPELPLVNFDDVCDEVVTCGKVTKTYNEIWKIAGFVAWKYGRTRVSIMQRLISCSGGEPQCKYIVECAIEVIYRRGAMEKIATTKTSTLTDKSDCCTLGQGYDFNSGFPPQLIPNNETCSWDQTEAEPTFNCVTDGPNANYGAEQSTWINRFKVYDTADDIPAMITFGPEDGVNSCVYEQCQVSTQTFAFTVVGENFPPNVGGNVVNVVTATSCGYCFSLERECDDCLELIGNYCPCEPNDLRIDSSPLIAFGFDSFSYVNNPWRVDNTVCHTHFYQNINAYQYYGDCEDCIDHPLGYSGVGVPVEERNDCNWWDCYRCNDGADPIVDVHQQKQSTVDAYSFSSIFIPSVVVFELDFPEVTITLIP
jgi:hypothetical protein